MKDNYSVAVIGAGEMGYGLAVHFVTQKQDVTLIDHREENLERAKTKIRESVAFLNEHEMAGETPDEVINEIRFTLDTEAGVADADIVLETISEDLEAKQRLLAEVAPHVPDAAIIASNTSSIPITDIAESVPESAGAVVGCHWWNPPYLLTPVEVIKGERTTEETMDRITEFVRSVDRDPILVEKDAPGFVWNRVQFAVVRECVHIAEEGIASLEDVNRAIRDGYAVRSAAVGPLETIDINGLGLYHTIAKDLYPDLTDADEPHQLVRDRVEDGNTGVDSGAGFFEYDTSTSDVISRRDERVTAIRDALQNRAEGLDQSE